MNELLSKLKMAGRLRFWRGTVEIDERELHDALLEWLRGDAE